MAIRRSAGQSPQAVFTADFHQLVQGELRPGPCVIRYDPFRIVPAEEYAAPRPVTMHAAFHPTDKRWDCAVSVPGRLHAYLMDISGQNLMLQQTFEVPAGCDELECWFSYTDSRGHELYDSHEGTNFWLRFPLHDLSFPHGVIIDSPDPGVDRLQIELTSLAVVDQIVARWRLTHPPGPRQTIALVSSAAPDDRKAWSIAPPGAPVATGATGVFDLVYTVGGRQFTDDNEGTWYLAAPAGVAV
jgi:hypothetical protein